VPPVFRHAWRCRRLRKLFGAINVAFIFYFCTARQTTETIQPCASSEEVGIEDINSTAVEFCIATLCSWTMTRKSSILEYEPNYIVEAYLRFMPPCFMFARRCYRRRKITRHAQSQRIGYILSVRAWRSTNSPKSSYSVCVTKSPSRDYRGTLFLRPQHLTSGGWKSCDYLPNDTSVVVYKRVSL